MRRQLNHKSHNAAAPPTSTASPPLVMAITSVGDEASMALRNLSVVKNDLCYTVTGLVTVTVVPI